MGGEAPEASDPSGRHVGEGKGELVKELLERFVAEDRGAETENYALLLTLLVFAGVLAIQSTGQALSTLWVNLATSVGSLSASIGR